MRFEIIKYNAALQAGWDDLIKRSSNGTFLHLRHYMDYHTHRFEDFSLMIYEGLKLRAVLPAHRYGRDIFAHKGLTYSDFIFQKKLKIERKIAIVAQVLHYLMLQNFQNLYIRSIPFPFQSVTDESQIYIYHKTGAIIEKILPFFIIDTRNSIKPNQNRRKNLKKLLKYNFQIDNNISDLTGFWKIVEKNLQNRYKTAPVHNINEISLLAKRFPKQIQLFTIKHKHKILAGALVYFINQTAHFQYIHTNDEPDSRQAVEFLTFELVKQFNKYMYISFGNSAVSDNNLNKNLVYWKESLGCQIINQLFFKIKTKNYNRLKNVLQ